MTDQTLSTELDHWYHVASLRYRQFLESLTALDLDDARRHLDLFARLLLGTLDAGEAGVEEIDDALNGDGEAGLLRTDFMILRRSLHGLADALNQIEEKVEQGGQARTAMVDRLDTFVRTANILARHHERMESTVLPLLDRHLGESRSREIARSLSASMHRAQPN